MRRQSKQIIRDIAHDMGDKGLPKKIDLRVSNFHGFVSSRVPCIRYTASNEDKSTGGYVPCRAGIFSRKFGRAWEVALEVYAYYAAQGIDTKVRRDSPAVEVI